MGPLVKFSYKSVASDISLGLSSGKVPLAFSFALFDN